MHWGLNPDLAAPGCAGVAPRRGWRLAAGRPGADRGTATRCTGVRILTSPRPAAQVWRHGEGGGWQQDGLALTGHSDWVRDVAWAPNLGLPANTLASAGQDGRVFIWAEQAGGGWERTLLQDFQARPGPLTCSSRVRV